MKASVFSDGVDEAVLVLSLGHPAFKGPNKSNKGWSMGLRSLIRIFGATFLAGAAFVGCGRKAPTHVTPAFEASPQMVGTNSTREPSINTTASLETARITAAPRLEPKDIFNRAGSSVVVVKTYDQSARPVALGSGFFIDDGLKVVSNFHVVSGAAKIEVLTADGAVEDIREVLAVSPELDLVICSTRREGKPLPLSTNSPEIGERILTLGNPMGLQRSISDGLISGVRDHGGKQLYQISAAISPGSSGGPVLTETGEVIGVATFTLLDAQNVNFAVPSLSVRELLARARPVNLVVIGDPKRDELAFGKGGLELVKAALSNGVIGVSIHNTTQATLEGAVIRVMYFEPLADESLGQRTALTLESERIAKERHRLLTLVESAEKNHERDTNELDALSSLRPETLSTADGELLAKLPTEIKVSAQMYISAKRSYLSYRQPDPNGYLRQFSDEALLRLKMNIATFQKSSGDRLKAGETKLAEFREKLKRLEEQASENAKALATLEQEAAARPKRQPRMIHYEDKLVAQEIAAGMTRYFEFACESKPDWTAEVRILDHIFRGRGEQRRDEGFEEVRAKP